LDEGRWEVTVQNPDGRQATLPQGLWVRAAELGCREVVVHFAFDTDHLEDAAHKSLDHHMACFQSQAATIRIEGHADERGTIDYNLALGQRRAQQVRDYLTGLAVSDARIETVSYGEERPADEAHSEAAWASNRRADIQATE
jgi:peptidoglycan-associated lipoprotein